MVNATIRAWRHQALRRDSIPPSGLQLDIPVEIIAPALVQVIRRERAPVLLQLPSGRSDRLAVRMHMSFGGCAPALLEVAWRASRRDILPRCPPPVGSRNDMVERQLPVNPGMSGGEFVAEEQV